MLQSHRWSFRDEGSGDKDQCYYIESDTSLKDILSEDKEKNYYQAHSWSHAYD